MKTGMLVLLVVGSSSAHALPDPTRPPDYGLQVPSVASKDTTEWRLSGITISSVGRSAILNQQVVIPGQILGNVTILEIQPNRVMLLDGDEQVEVRMDTRMVKRRVD